MRRAYLFIGFGIACLVLAGCFLAGVFSAGRELAETAEVMLLFWRFIGGGR